MEKYIVFLSFIEVYCIIMLYMGVSSINNCKNVFKKHFVVVPCVRIGSLQSLLGTPVFFYAKVQGDTRRERRLKGNDAPHSYEHICYIEHLLSVKSLLCNVFSALYDLCCVGAPYKHMKTMCRRSVPRVAMLLRTDILGVDLYKVTSGEDEATGIWGGS